MPTARLTHIIERVGDGVVHFDDGQGGDRVAQMLDGEQRGAQTRLQDEQVVCQTALRGGELAPARVDVPLVELLPHPELVERADLQKAWENNGMI